MSVQETYLQGIADAIRAKLGTTGTIKASEFASKIATIPTGVAKPGWILSESVNMAYGVVGCYGYDKFVLLQYGNSNIAYSFNGINWLQELAVMPSSDNEEYAESGDDQGWCAICYGAGKFVALTMDTDHAAYSLDGINWIKSTMPGARTWTSVCYGQGKFVAVANESILTAYSDDGINWSSGRLPATNSWSSVCYGQGKFVAVASYSNAAAYSTDGINWTETTLPFTTGAVSLVCYGRGKFVTVGTNGAAAYSTDGINWTLCQMPFSSDDGQYGGEYLCYGNGKFVSSGLYYDVNGNGHQVGIYSADGINWELCSLPIDPSGSQEYSQYVCYGDGMFITKYSQTGGINRLNDYFDEWA